MNSLKSIFGLSLSLTKSHLILKNEGTLLGVLWYVLGPLITFFFILNIFQDRLGNNIPQYPLYLLLGILLFNFFRTVTSECVGLIRKNAGLINSLPFPYEALVVSAILKTLFAHIFEILVLIAFLLFFKIPFLTILFYPIVLFLLLLFTIGCSLILASLGAYFFDLNQIWGFLVSGAWFVTPIFYSIENQERLLLLNMFNPMYFIITFARDLIIYVRIPDLHIMIGAVGYSVLAFVVGIVVFNKMKNKFSELV